MRQQILINEHADFRYPQSSIVNCQLSILNSYWRTFGITNDLKRDGVQLYHGLSGELPIGLRKAGIPGLVTIHDLIFLRHPEYYPWIDAKLYAWKFRQTLKEADHIIAISQRTKVDIMEFGDVPPERISVVYQSYNPRFSATPSAETQAAVRKRYGLPEHFILNVGTIGFTYVQTQFDYFTSELKIVKEVPYGNNPSRLKVKCYGADDVREGVALLRGSCSPTCRLRSSRL